MAWQQWVLRAPTARVAGPVLAVAAGSGLAVTVPVILADLLRDHPTPHVNQLVPAAVVLLVAGALWAIICTQLRHSMGELPPKPGRSGFQTALIKVLGTLTGIGFALLVVTSVRHGGPTTPVPGCPYRIENHGSFTCVSAAAYAHVAAGVQRFICCIFSGFFVVTIRQVRYASWAQRQEGGLSSRVGPHLRVDL